MVIISLYSCQSQSDKKTNENQSEEVITKEIQISNENDQVKDLSSNIVKEFSWDNIPESTVDIGVYPYITPPKGMIIDKDESKSYEFDKEKGEGKIHFKQTNDEQVASKIKIVIDYSHLFSMYHGRIELEF